MGVILASIPASGAVFTLTPFDDEGPYTVGSQKVIASFLGITPQYMSQLLRQDGDAK